MGKYRIGLLAFALTSVAALASANAADIYVPSSGGYKDGPVYSPLWTGPYIGVNGGYGWGGDSRVFCDGFDFCDKANLGTDSKSFSSSGGFGGGQIGYNWQPLGSGGYKDGPVRGNFVFGIEADIEGSGIEGSGTISSPFGSATAKDTLDWFGTVRGRVGYAFGSALLYGTGGFAFGGVQDKLTLSGSTAAKNDKTATGYAAGGGMEYAFNPAWSGKVEYQYINLGTDSLASSGVTADFNHEYNTVRVGLNYHIRPGYEPLK